MEKSIMVSVAIPFYNQEKFVAETINSVLNQKTNFEFEIVVGDDCSKDRTPAIIKDFQSRYPDKIKVILNEKNLGLVLNIKNILDSCCGKYIALLGGDDFFCSEYKLQKQVDSLELRADVGLVYSDAKLLIEMPGQKRCFHHSANKFYNREPKSGNVYEACLIKFFILPSTAMFRRKLYQLHVDYNKIYELGVGAEDFPLYLELSRVSKFLYIDESSVMYRVSSGSITRPGNKDKYYAFLNSCFLGRLYYLDKYPVSEQTRQIVLYKFYIFKLEYAFDYRLLPAAKEAYGNLKAMGKANFLTLLHFWGTNSPVIRIILRVLQRFSKVFSLNFC